MKNNATLQKQTAHDRQGEYIPQSDLASYAEMAMGHMTQKQASEASGLPQSRISEAVRGLRDSAAIELIVRLAPDGVAPRDWEPAYFFPRALLDWLDDQRIASNEAAKSQDLVDYPIDPRQAAKFVGKPQFWCEHTETDRVGFPVSIDPEGSTRWEPGHINGTDGSIETTPTSELVFWLQGPARD